MDRIILRLQEIKGHEPEKYQRICARLARSVSPRPAKHLQVADPHHPAHLYATLQTLDVASRPFWQQLATSWRHRPDTALPPPVHVAHQPRPDFFLLKQTLTSPSPLDMLQRLCLFNHPSKILRVIQRHLTAREVLFALRTKFGLGLPGFLRLKSQENLDGLVTFNKNQQALSRLVRSLHADLGGHFDSRDREMADLSPGSLEGAAPRQRRHSSVAETRLCPERLPPTSSDDSRVSDSSDPESAAVRVATDRLERLRVIFEESDLDDEPGLDMDEFKLAMRRISGDGMNEREMALVFMKVDANCDGNVDWNEFLDYTLREYQERDAMSQVTRERYLETSAVLKYQGNKELRAQVWAPQAAAPTERALDWTSGRYYSVTVDGIVQCWTVELTRNGHPIVLIPDFRSASCHERVTDMLCIPEIRALAIGFTTGLIRLYYYDEASLELLCTIYGLAAPPERMTYNFREYLGMLLFADTLGRLFAVKLANLFYDGFWTSAGVSQRPSHFVAWADLRKVGRCMELRRIPVTPQNPILQIRFCPEINAVMACTNDPGHSLILLPVQSSRPTLQISHAPSGFNCFDYHPVAHLIATGSSDRSLRLWQPDKLVTPSAVFVNHNAAVDQVRIVHESHFTAVITVDALRTIRVFNVREHLLWQEIVPPTGNLRKLSVSVLLYNPAMKHFVYGASELFVVERALQHQQADQRGHVQTHSAPLVAALYNELFDCVVSGCQASIIMVWNFQNGHKIIHFGPAHVQESIMGAQAVPIRAMAFDSSQRRLLTVGEDGTTKIWNFNNGACLSTFHQCTGVPLNTVQYHKNRDLVVAGGCEQVLFMVRDTRGDDDVDAAEHWLPRIHRTDIISIGIRYAETPETPSSDAVARSSSGDSALANEGSRLISVSFDGEIIIWDVYSCAPLLFLNTDGATTVLTVEERNLRVFPYIWGATHVPHLQPETASISEFLQPIRTAPAKGGQQARHKPREKVRNETTAADSTSERIPSLPSAASDAVSCLLLLDARPANSARTATILTASVDGFVRAWSEVGGLCAVFHGGKSASNYIRCMAADVHNELLFTGDNAGYLTVYCICQWANADTDPEHQHRFDPRPFPAIRRYKAFGPVLAYLNNRLMRQALAKLDTRHGQLYSMPVVLNVYRAHLSAIQHISVILQRQIVITSSLDCSVRLWTFAGLYIGTLGQSGTLHLDIGADAPPVPHYDFQPHPTHPTDAHAALEEIFAEKDTLDEILLQPRTVVPPDLASRASRLTLEVINDLQHPDLLHWLQTESSSTKVAPIPPQVSSPQNAVVPEAIAVEDDSAIYSSFTVKSVDNLSSLHDLVPSCVYDYNVEKVQKEWIGRLAPWQRPEFIRSQRQGTLHGQRMRQLVQLAHARPGTDRRHRLQRSPVDAGHVRTTLRKMGSSGRRTLVDFLLQPDAAGFVGTLLSHKTASLEMENSEADRRQRRRKTAVPVVAGNMNVLTDIQRLEKQARRRKRPLQPVQLALVPDADETRLLKGEWQHGAWDGGGAGRAFDIPEVERKCVFDEEDDRASDTAEAPTTYPVLPLYKTHSDAEYDDCLANRKHLPVAAARAVHRAPLSARAFLTRRNTATTDEETTGQDAHYEKVLYILSQPLQGRQPSAH